MSIPTGASTQYVFAMDYRYFSDTGRFAIFPMSGLNITDFAGVQNGSVDDMYAAFQDGIVRKLDCDINDDSGTAIPRHFTQVISGVGIVESANEYRKQYHKLNTYIKPTESTLTMTPSYAVDLADDTQIRTGTYTDLGSETVTSWPGTGVKRKDIRLFGISGKSMALKWTHNAVAENFVMQPSSVDYEFKQKIEIV